MSEQQMNIALALKHLFPDKIQPDDYYVFEEVDGVPEIIIWNMEEPQPTEEELQAAWLDYQANLPAPPKTDIQILGEQLVAKDLEIMELKQLNDALGSQVVDHDIRLMIGGL
jgi:XkdW protein